MRLHRLAIAALLAALTALSVPAAAAAAPQGAAPDGARLATTGSARLVGPFHVWNTNSALCLVARTGSGERPAVQSTCDFDAGQYWADQYWELRPVTSTTWQIYSPLLNRCLVTRGSGESAAVTTGCGTWADQVWRWWLNGDGTEQFENTNSGLCLTTRGSGESAAVATTCDWKVGARWADQRWYTF